jgi:monoterpene epsilon-lactone hydrolase
MNSRSVDPDGTAHITRTIPVPKTLSPEAQDYLKKPPPAFRTEKWTLEQVRTAFAVEYNGLTEELKKSYPVTVEEKTLGGVKTRLVHPVNPPAGKRDRIIINFHGGGFVVGAADIVEAVPIASLTQTTVVAVDYRLGPEHPYPAALDDAVAVYKELLKTYKPGNIGVYGCSAGAILTGQMTSQLRKLGLPLPGALGIFSGTGDMDEGGDSTAINSLTGFWGEVQPPSKEPHRNPYYGDHDIKDPVISPLHADLRGFPPALFVTSSRDLLFSPTVEFHRAFVRAGVDAQLIVFDGLPHTFWTIVLLPESREAYSLMSEFFSRKLGHADK